MRVVRRTLRPLLGWEPAEHDTAWDRAEVLLRDSLSAEDHALYLRRGYIEVPSSLHPGRVYRVDGWRPVAVFERGQFLGAICIRPREHLPGPDVILARKLLIEGAEDKFLASGNWLSPAFRPAGALPSMLMVVVVLSPWLVQLGRFGLGGVAAGAVLLLLPLVLLWRRRPARPADLRRADAPQAGR
jgi:hypothetical protein